MRELSNVMHFGVGATKRAHLSERGRGTEGAGEPARAGGAMSVRQHSACLTGRRSLSRGARERGGDGRLRRQSETVESAKETG